MYPSVHPTPDCDPDPDTRQAGEDMVKADLKRLALAGLALAITSAAVVPALEHAQARTPQGVLTQADSDRIQSELERTDQVLIRAADHLRDCESIRGRSLLREGRRIQSDAWARFRSRGESPEERRRDQAAAIRLTRSARDLAIKAIEACQVDFKAHQSIISMLESTQELAAEAGEAVRLSGSMDARRLLDAGVRQLEHAGDAYRSREMRRAITVGAAARRLIQRAVQRAQMDAGAGGAERAERALDRTDQIIREMAGPIGRGDRRVTALMDRARVEQDQARSLYREGRFEQALRLTQTARRSVLDAWWQAQRAPDPDRVMRALEVVERVLQETGPEILRSGAPEALKLLEAAEGQVESAHTFLAQGDAVKAARAVRTADSLLRRASEGAGR